MEKVVKHTKPTRYDKYPRGTVWSIEQEDPSTFIQVNHDENNPTWQPLGQVLEIAASKCIRSRRFILKVLDIFDMY
jgi:hypothetical protein